MRERHEHDQTDPKDRCSDYQNSGLDSLSDVARLVAPKCANSIQEFAKQIEPPPGMLTGRL